MHYTYLGNFTTVDDPLLILQRRHMPKWTSVDVGWWQNAAVGIIVRTQYQKQQKQQQTTTKRIVYRQV